MHTVKSSPISLAVCLALAWAGLGMARSAHAASLVTPGTDTGANVIVIHAQDVNAGQVLVDSVTAARDGWLLIRNDKKGAPHDVIGFVPVRQGTTVGLRVDVQLADMLGDDNITPTLWATLVADPFALTPFVTPGREIKQYASLVAVAFASRTAVSPRVSFGPAGAYNISVRAQDVNVGQLIVDSVTTARDGWLLIRKDDGGLPGQIIGFAPMRQGTTVGIRVDVQLTDMYGNDNITPVLWATLAPDPNALTPFVAPDFVVLQQASAASVAFSSSAASAAPSQATATVSASSSSSAVGANRITVQAQGTSSGQVVVDSVTATRDGWLLICQNANGAPGPVLGFAPVHPGVTRDVRITIRTTNARGNDIVTAVLWATLVADPNALNPFAAPDAALGQREVLARAAFGAD